MKIGHARVSTDDLNPDWPLDVPNEMTDVEVESFRTGDFLPTPIIAI